MLAAHQHTYPPRNVKELLQAEGNVTRWKSESTQNDNYPENGIYGEL